MSADLEQPVTEPETPPAVEDAATTEEAPVEQAESDEVVLEIPDSSQEGGKARLVPAAALAGARGEAKRLKAELATAKEGSAKAAQLEQQLAALQQQVQQMSPYVQAYQAAMQQQPPQQTPEDDTEAREFAQNLDLWKPDGTPDVDKARKILGAVDKRAKAHAEQSTAPLVQRSVQQQSAYNLQRALNTDVNGIKPDAEILKAFWGRLDPSVTADETQAKLLVVQALGTMAMQGKTAQPAQRNQAGQFTKAADEPLPPPLHVEKAGGKDTPNSMPLSDKEKASLKDLGMTEKEYLESARNAPWLR